MCVCQSLYLFTHLVCFECTSEETGHFLFYCCATAAAGFIVWVCARVSVLVCISAVLPGQWVCSVLLQATQ